MNSGGNKIYQDSSFRIIQILSILKMLEFWMEIVNQKKPTL